MSGIVGTNAGRSSGKVGSVAIGADAITGDEIADDVLDSEHYVAASIDNEHLADNAVGTDEIADNAVTLAKMAGGTDGNIISFDASGNPVAIATGNDGMVLTSAGAGAPPAFEAAAGGGKVLQCLQTIITGTVTSTSTSMTNITGLAQAITPSASSSKILIIANVNWSGSSEGGGGLQLARGSTAIGIGDAAGSRFRAGSGQRNITASTQTNASMMFLDSPSTTSATTYNVMYRTRHANIYVNRSDDDTDSSQYHRTSSTITVMEIGA